MDIYDKLGIRKVVNGHATLTKLGGSIMPQVVLDAMAEAARHFVDIDKLQEKVGERIAQLTKNEAAYVSCGAAAGLALATAACITGMDSEKRARLPYTDGMKNEVIVHKSGRVGYDFAIRQAGGKLVEIGSESETSPDDMERAINEKTAAIFYFYNITRMKTHVPLEKGVEISRRRDVPLIVDAAAQLPPVENLWWFTRDMGADLSIFSGGKGLCGPQSSGLILGRKDLINACAFNACPRAFIGRPMKVGKEEMIGLLAAVERYVNLDHDKLMKTYEEQVQYVIDAFTDVPHISARRNFPSEAGQPMPRAEIILEKSLDLTRDEVLSRLLEGEPSVALAGAGANGIFINPQTLELGQEKIIIDRIKEIIL